MPETIEKVQKKFDAATAKHAKHCASVAGTLSKGAADADKTIAACEGDGVPDKTRAAKLLSALKKLKGTCEGVARKCSPKTTAAAAVEA